MSRVAITGAAGVVGRALVERLAGRGHEIFALNSRKLCDLESFSETRDFFERTKPEYVYHIAGAVFGLGGNSAFPGDAFRRNVLINTHVVEASRLAGVRKIVAMGSTAMYADQATPFYCEEDVMNGRPHSSEQAYGFAKRAMLIQLESYAAQFGMQFSFAVATNMYGPHDRFDPRYGHVIPSLISKFAEADRTGGVVEVWGDGSPTRDFLYAKDAAAGLELLMAEGSGVFNLATGVSCTIAELVSHLSALFPSVKYRWDTTKPMGQVARSYAVDRIRALGFSPTYSLPQGLYETVEWFKSNPGNIRRYE